MRICNFGAEYDSMADMVSFGMAPALLAYNWALADLGKLGWAAAFVYCAAAALRLARFNTQVGVADKRYFQGLASPAAAAVIAGSIWCGTRYQFEIDNVSYVMTGITGIAGLLMVSNFRYHSFKEIDWRGKVNFLVMLLFSSHATNSGYFRCRVSRTRSHSLHRFLLVCFIWASYHY